ncbi:helix-turn-helix domain-containing protein [Spongiactinospora sp. TRM90649]|uniref:helix-turn-helix domain-containing protein n=1 Tax=Spongiactinospora sp. TRM90649 TaxID=3031114 RepID=UPI0023F82926|nr:helix-turn-helix domain-containing protein [Spongiactinospora sp. TRM90649]MDF5758120.1 helix-turn-helix domain-containing protein [Spongiactinospora sp. TRM90649]
MSAGRLTLQDRRRIATGLAEGRSYAEIARRLDRPTSTISREVGRNGGPGGYRPERAHQATARRARRGTLAGSPVAEPRGHETFEMEGSAVEMAVGMGLPKMMARVLIGLWLSEEGRLTAAELSRGLKVSPASISMAVGYLAQQGLIRRERDPRRRRDIYVVDDDAWYHSTVIGSRQTLAAAELAKAAGQALGLDTPVGRRLARGGAFLERISLDGLASAERWRDLPP